jgi:hypothetical protein
VPASIRHRKTTNFIQIQVLAVMGISFSTGKQRTDRDAFLSSCLSLHLSSRRAISAKIPSRQAA